MKVVRRRRVEITTGSSLVRMGQSFSTKGCHSCPPASACCDVPRHTCAVFCSSEVEKSFGISASCLLHSAVRLRVHFDSCWCSALKGPHTRKRSVFHRTSSVINRLPTHNLPLGNDFRSEKTTADDALDSWPSPLGASPPHASKAAAHRTFS